MKKLRLVAIATVLMLAGTANAQSTYENISANTVENKQVDSYYQQWLSQYEQVGSEINEISEQYDKEVAKRGYPKKKTVQAKIELVKQYITLLETQLTDSRLNDNLDTGKVKNKIAAWKKQQSDLENLLKKI